MHFLLETDWGGGGGRGGGLLSSAPLNWTWRVARAGMVVNLLMLCMYMICAEWATILPGPRGRVGFRYMRAVIVDIMLI